MLEIGTVVLRSSLSIRGEIEVFASIWVKPNSLALAAKVLASNNVAQKIYYVTLPTGAYYVR